MGRKGSGGRAQGRVGNMEWLVGKDQQGFAACDGDWREPSWQEKATEECTGGRSLAERKGCGAGLQQTQYWSMLCSYCRSALRLVGCGPVRSMRVRSLACNCGVCVYLIALFLGVCLGKVCASSQQVYILAGCRALHCPSCKHSAGNLMLFQRAGLGSAVCGTGWFSFSAALAIR